jgi:hypothetical protein
MAVAESIPPELFLGGHPGEIRDLAERGIWMTDPDGLVRGAHLHLRTVRFVTYEPGDPIPTDALVHCTREASELAALGSAGRRRPAR